MIESWKNTQVFGVSYQEGMLSRMCLAHSLNFTFGTTYVFFSISWLLSKLRGFLTPAGPPDWITVKTGRWQESIRHHLQNLRRSFRSPRRPREPTFRCLLSAAASWDSMRSCMFLHCLITTLRTESGFVQTGCFSPSFFSFRVSKSLCRAIKGSLMLYFP